MKDVTFPITIPGNKVSIFTPRYRAGNPIPQIPDPDWINPDDGSVAPLVDEYGLKEWVKMDIISHVKMICKRGQNTIALEADDENSDDDIIQ